MRIGEKAATTLSRGGALRAIARGLGLGLALVAGCGDSGGRFGDAGSQGADLVDAGIIAAPVDSGLLPSSGILVDEVYDGDTIRVSASASQLAPDGRLLSGQHIRFLGIDAPEIAHGDRPAECFGVEASDFLRKLIGGTFIRLDFDRDHEVRDPYDRLLAYVVLEDGRVANEILVEEGYARSYRSFPQRERDHYNALEREAKAQHRGMWSCPR